MARNASIRTCTPRSRLVSLNANAEIGSIRLAEMRVGPLNLPEQALR
jgi:hypothetical protein